MAKGFTNAVNAVLRQANANASRCVCVWSALALREEGFDREGIKRVLDNIIKYSRLSCGKTDIQEQLDHIANVTGLRIVWKSDDKVEVEEIADWEDFDTEGNEDDGETDESR